MPETTARVAQTVGFFVLVGVLGTMYWFRMYSTQEAAPKVARLWTALAAVCALLEAQISSAWAYPLAAASVLAACVLAREGEEDGAGWLVAAYAAALCAACLWLAGSPIGLPLAIAAPGALVGRWVASLPRSRNGRSRGRRWERPRSLW